MYFYLDAVTYNNLKDQAISLAIEWFLNDEFGKEREELLAELKEQGIDFEKITTMYSVKDNLICFDDRKCAVQSKLEEFAKYKMIITDRLHGMIFSILSNTPCLALDNSNHKVSGVYSIIKDIWDIAVTIASYRDVMEMKEVWKC